MLPEEYVWPSIAHDIAMMYTPAVGATTYKVEDIIKNYGISMETFSELMKVETFRELIISEVSRIKKLGDHAGVRLRAESMSVKLQEVMFAKAINNELDDDLAIKLLGMLLKSAGLEQPPEVIKAQAQAQSNTVNIAFNVPKLKNKKLSHLMSQPQTNIVDAGV